MSGNYKIIRNNFYFQFSSNISTVCIFVILYLSLKSAINNVTNKSPGKFWEKLLGFDPSNNLRRLRNPIGGLMSN